MTKIFVLLLQKTFYHQVMMIGLYRYIHDALYLCGG